MVFPDDQDASSAGVFLDIRPRVNDRGNEEGLLGLAFDPDYGSNGYFYVYYSASNPRRSVVSRFSVSASDPDSADPDSERIVLEVPQPYSNHNGGQIVFGPDGRLYIGLGDGGSRNDPHGNGQDLSTLLGSILRIDVSGLDDVGVYSIPAGNPFAGGDGRSEGRDMGLRAAQSVAVHLRPAHGRSLGRGCGAEQVRGDRRRQARRELRLERDGGRRVLPAHGRLRPHRTRAADSRVRTGRGVLGHGRVRVPRREAAVPLRGIRLRGLLQRKDMGAQV